jgi:hypothetical protein
MNLWLHRGPETLRQDETPAFTMPDPLRLLLTQFTQLFQICANTERQMSAWGKANGVKGDDIVSLPT